MKILGVDIGSFSIKVAEVDVTSKGYTLTQFFEFPLSPDPTKDRNLETIELLRDFSSQYDKATTRWILGVPQHRVSVHQKRFPFRERQKILKSLAFELEDEIPLDIDETIFDAKVVEYVGEMSDVLTIAAPKDVIQEVISLAKDGGFEVDIVSVEGLALANCFEAWNASPPIVSPAVHQPEDLTSTGITTSHPARLVLQLGHQHSTLLVYRDQGLVAVRSILWGGAEIATALARAFGIPYFEALKTLQTKSFILTNSAGATKDQLLMSQTIAGIVTGLLSELRLTLLEVRSAFNLEFKEMEILGGVSRIQNLGAYLTQSLEIPVNSSHHLQKQKNTRFELSPHIEAVSGVAIGLAFEGLKRPRNPAINLRKLEFAQENRTFKEFWERWRLPVQVMVASFVIFSIYSFVRDIIAYDLVVAVDERLTQVAAQPPVNLKGSQASQSGVERYIRRQKTIIKNHETLQQLESYTSAMDILARLSKDLPVQRPPQAGQGIEISRLNIDNDDVTIEGRALSPAMLPLIEKALGDIARPKSVVKDPSANVAPGPGSAFAYKMKINRKP